MSETIKTYSDLCAERERVKNLLVVQKQRIRDDWDGLKHEFIPVKNALGVFGKMTKPDKSNPLINKGVKVATDLFISKFVLGKAGWVAKLAVPFVLKNYSTHLIADKGKTFVTKVAAFLNNRKKYGVRETVNVKRQTAEGGIHSGDPTGLGNPDLIEKVAVAGA